MRIRLAAAVLFLAAATARAGWFGRSKLVSRWTVKTVDVVSDDSDWDEESAFEEDGLSVLAKNDANNLYLLITAHTVESRDQLSGESHQDLSLWFVSTDGKTRRWGIRLPYGRRAPMTGALRDPAGLDPEPESVKYVGAAISSGSLPDDVLDRMTAVGRRPVWELKIPLDRLEVKPEGIAAVDFIVSAPPGGPKRRAAPKAPARTDSPADGGADAAPVRGGGHGGRRGGAADHPEDYVWDASSYTLWLHLARDPALAR